MNNENIPAIRYKEFADVWEQYELGNVADIIGGGTPSTSVDGYWGGDVDWYAPAEIGEQIYLTGSQKKITELGLQESSAKMLPVGTVLFTSRAGIGNTAILAKTGATNQGFQSLVPKKNTLDSYFIFSRTHELKRYGETVGAGSTFVEVSGKQMARMPIMLPKMNEQHKIGQLFVSLDNLITLHKREHEKTVNIKKAMLEKMFPKDGEDKPEIRFAGFTEAWERRRLDELCLIGDIDHRMPSSVESGIPYLMTGDFIGINGLDFESAKRISIEDYEQLSKKIKPEQGDILFARYASVGTVRYVETNDKFLISYSCAIMKPNDYANGKYIFYNVQSNKTQRQIELEINTGSQRNIGIDSLKKLEIWIPEIIEQEKISTFFANLDLLITSNQCELIKLQNMKKSLLKKMFV